MEIIPKFNKHRAFNKVILHGKRSKINKRRAYVYYVLQCWVYIMCEKLFPTFCFALRTIISKLKENIVGSKNFFNFVITYLLSAFRAHEQNFNWQWNLWWPQYYVEQPGSQTFCETKMDLFAKRLLCPQSWFYWGWSFQVRSFK